MDKMPKIRKCKDCERYTMKENCPLCGKQTLIMEPPRYSPQDKYGKYRRLVKFKELEEEGSKSNDGGDEDGEK